MTPEAEFARSVNPLMSLGRVRSWKDEAVAYTRTALVDNRRLIQRRWASCTSPSLCPLVPVAVTIALLLGATGVLAEPAPLSFKGAVLGMTLEDWRSLPPPPGAEPAAVPNCSTDKIVPNLGRVRLSGNEPSSDVVTCSYDDVLGSQLLPRSVLLDGNYRATNLSYLFRGGRLFDIRFDASIDAFADVMAMLKGSHGRPTSTVRDTVQTEDGQLARVRQIWSMPAGRIELVDPSNDFTKLRVDIGSPSASIAASPDVR